MKKDRNSRYIKHKSYDEYPFEDSRYYGLFVCGKSDNRKVKIDPKRFQKATNMTLSEKQQQFINNRKSHYFHPYKNKYYDYKCNVFVQTINSLKQDWHEHFKPLIDIAKNRVRKPQKVEISDYDLFLSGISSHGSANAWAAFENMISECNYQRKCLELVDSMYAQFMHQSASRIEAVTVKILTEANAIEDHFDRNILYGSAAGKEQKVSDLKNFNQYDKVYCIWNFIKHNSNSTYKTLKDRYPEVLKNDMAYKQGSPAFAFVNFSESLVLDLLKGSADFFKEYCHLVFEEDYEQAQWNYADYFFDIMNQERENIINPLGLNWWDDID